MTAHIPATLVLEDGRISRKAYGEVGKTSARWSSPPA